MDVCSGRCQVMQSSLPTAPAARCTPLPPLAARLHAARYPFARCSLPTAQCCPLLTTQYSLPHPLPVTRRSLPRCPLLPACPRLPKPRERPPCSASSATRVIRWLTYRCRRYTRLAVLMLPPPLATDRVHPLTRSLRSVTRLCSDTHSRPALAGQPYTP
jgi:hypothetical protein